MSTALATEMKPGEIRVFSAPPAVNGSYTFTDNEDGSTLVQGLEIFKAGTFRDSWGDQATWTEAHLDMMVAHFSLLRASGAFPNVPFRADHSFSIDKVVGYIEALGRAGDKLTADVLLTEPTAVDKFKRGTYRSRSLELGMYTTNDEAAYYPVVMGCAFVDIPAVEGLFRNGQTVKSFSFFSASQTPQEATVPDQPAPTTPPAPHAFRVGKATETDYAKVQAHIDAVEGERDALQLRVAAADDFAKGVKETERKAFVAQLATDKKIAQPQVAALEAMVADEAFTDAQFEGFKKAYEAAPVLSLLGNHGGGSEGGNPEASPESERTQRIEDLQAIVRNHQLAHMSDENIKKTHSYKELQTLLTAAS